MKPSEEIIKTFVKKKITENPVMRKERFFHSVISDRKLLSVIWGDWKCLVIEIPERMRLVLADMTRQYCPDESDGSIELFSLDLRPEELPPEIYDYFFSESMKLQDILRD
ncbi:hypothetical protein C4588_05530 [Candidatus Parcubacteria bacterium]|nr:MAG: hypothetical protein C4588_05530 [Candidatus Parcubacteria bacterium]